MAVLAHRISYEMQFGPIPSGYVICHCCDRRACVNPKHLFAASQRDDLLDAYKKGRIAFKPKEIHRPKIPKGITIITPELMKGIEPLTVEERFWSHVQKTTECWLWTGCLSRVGYGSMNYGLRKTAQAHRVSYELAYGKIPDGLHVCHKCDVRHCVRPDHLFLGTDKDNSDDKIKKGRMPIGEKAPKAKLTGPQVLEIRSLHNSGTISIRQLANRYGVRYQSIHLILKRINWKHI